MSTTMNKHIVVIGCGTGRSGTVSLSKILNNCRNFICSHELDPLLPWEFSEAAYEKRKNHFLQAVGNIGDVHSVYLPYLERFIKDIPNIKIICTRRKCEEVADSFERHIDNGPHPRRNHWYEHGGREGWVSDPNWDATFPKYNIKNRNKAILRYARDYDAKIDELREKYPDNILVIPMTELSTFRGQNKIFGFVGIKLLDRSYTRKGHTVHNSSHKVVEGVAEAIAG